jgi:hypothetical protein
MKPDEHAPSRREVLSLAGRGLAATALLGVVGCTQGPDPSGTPSQGRRSTWRPTPRPTPSISPGTRFPGDPGTGRLYWGSSIRFDEPIAQVQATPPPTVSRRFYRPGQENALLAMARQDRAAGVLPFVSIKPPASWEAVARGDFDSWLNLLLDGLAQVPGPLMFAVQHEPENDVSPGQTAAHWVAMQQRVIRLGRQQAPRVTVVPVLMQYTFAPTSGRDPLQWLVPGADLQGIDVYNPWLPTSSSREWVSFPDLLGAVQSVVTDVPLVVPEYGCLTDPTDISRTRRWFYDAFDYAVANNVVGLAYFNGSGSDGVSWRADRTRNAAIATLSRRPQVARLAAA